MIVKDGWFAKQRFLKPDVSEDISNNRSSLSKAPSLSIVFSILNIAKHCLHVWFASPYLLSPAALPANPEQHRCGEQQHGRVPRPHGPLLQAGPGSARPAGHLGSVHLIYLLLSTGCLYKLSPINLVWGPLNCTKSNFNPVHVFLHFKSFGLVVLQLILTSKLSELEQFEKQARNCLFANKIEFSGKWLHPRAKLKKTDPT